MGYGKRREVKDDARVWPEPLEQSCHLLHWENGKGARAGICMVHAEFEMSTIHPQEATKDAGRYERLGFKREQSGWEIHTSRSSHSWHWGLNESRWGLPVDGEEYQGQVIDVGRTGRTKRVYKEATTEVGRKTRWGPSWRRLHRGRDAHIWHSRQDEAWQPNVGSNNMEATGAPGQNRSKAWVEYT